MEEHDSEDGSLQFFKIVFEPVSQGVRLPPLFINNHGHSFHHKTKVTLSVPSGDSWSVRLRRNDTGFWLGRGWQQFAAHYGIKARHFLVFKYLGSYRFRVIIMDPNASEIDYPRKAEDAEEMVGFDANPGGIQGTISKGEKERFDSYQKALGFRSENPFILSFQQPSYVLNEAVLWINSSKVRDFLPEDTTGSQPCVVKLGVPGGGKVWTTYWHVYRGGRKVLVRRGWKEFAVDNKLRVADTCLFELVDKAALHFDVTILRNN